MYKTTEYEHWFIYHLQKTEALICHCGWGTINAYRMMQHLRHIHSERVSQPQILARFYYHNIPEFKKVQVCERTFDGQRCEFRTPFIQIMAKHRCERDNRRFPIPERALFFSMLEIRDRPEQGVPPRHLRRTPPASRPEWREKAEEVTSSRREEQRLQEEARRSLPYFSDYARDRGDGARSELRGHTVIGKQSSYAKSLTIGRGRGAPRQSSSDSGVGHRSTEEASRRYDYLEAELPTEEIKKQIMKDKQEYEKRREYEERRKKAGNPSPQQIRMDEELEKIGKLRAELDQQELKAKEEYEKRKREESERKMREAAAKERLRKEAEEQAAHYRRSETETETETEVETDADSDDTIIPVRKGYEEIRKYRFPNLKKCERRILEWQKNNEGDEQVRYTGLLFMSSEYQDAALERVRIFMLNRIQPGRYWVMSDDKSEPREVRYLAVISYMPGNPAAQNHTTKKFRQRNPMDWASLVELEDVQTRPHTVTHEVTFNCTPEDGEYLLVYHHSRKSNPDIRMVVTRNSNAWGRIVDTDEYLKSNHAGLRSPPEVARGDVSRCPELTTTLPEKATVSEEHMDTDQNTPVTTPKVTDKIRTRKTSEAGSRTPMTFGNYGRDTQTPARSRTPVPRKSTSSTTDSPAGRMATPNSQAEELMEEDELTAAQESALLDDKNDVPSTSPASGTQV